MTVVIDTREQAPWSFPHGVTTKVGTIKQGDYALEGDNTFAIERKSLYDFSGTVRREYDRFTNELRRMDDNGFPAKIVIVEGDFKQYLYWTDDGGNIHEPEDSITNPDPVFMMQRIADLLMVRRTSVVFAADSCVAAALAYHIFCRRITQLKGGVR